MNAKTTTLGGGCFWCTEAVFQEIDGVLKVTSGYSGGHVKNPGYREVCSGRTGHAEVVQVSYDTDRVSLADLLRIHLSTHDPTSLNQQGADRGTQYRSVVFYNDEDEKQTAETVMAEIQKAYDGEIVTELRPFEHFYEAEQEHRNYYRNNPEAGSCRAVIAPKLKKFRALYDEIKKTA